MLSRRAALALAAVPLSSVSAVSQTRKRRRRADCYFGIHFDLHPNATDTELGKDVDEAMIRDFLDRVRPDFVQYDAKGHAGWLGWPSELSRSSPGIVRDSLAVWRKVTAEREVPLYVHFSGVWDSLAVAEHPEWARQDAEGKRDERQTSLWGPYADQRMIPQLLEVSAKYDLDGVWVDGDCWQTNPDYSPAALRAWLQMGLGAEAPKKAGDPHWDVWLEFQRQRFRDYVRHYAETLRRQRPNLEIASNWLYSTLVPEKPELPVDFLSGDYLGNAPLTQARLDARYLAQASIASGKPWDLMAWGFAITGTDPAAHLHKPAVQLQQEASVVLAQGGAFQIYYQPTRAGRIDERHIRTMAEVAEFCRERQALCQRSQSASEVGLLFSRQSLYARSGRLFGGWGKQLSHCTGMLDALLANFASVDVIPDWSTTRTPLLVISEWPELGARAAQDLVERVRGGLRLLLTGAENARRFAPLFGWRLQGEPTRRAAWVEGRELFGVASGLWQDVEAGAGKILAPRYATYDSRRVDGAAALGWEFGAGQVVLAPGPVGEVFAATHAPALRDFVGRLLRALQEPQIEVLGPAVPLEMVLRRQGAQTVLHLLNYAGQQVSGNFAAHDYIAPLPGQRIRVKLPARPQKVLWEPRGRALGFTYENGYVQFTTPEIAIHHMVSFA